MFSVLASTDRLTRQLPAVAFWLAFMLLIPLASAQDQPVSPEELNDPEALAERLGIVEGDEAVLGLRWTGSLDSIQVGVRRFSPVAPAPGEVGLLLVRELSEGIVPVSAVSGRTSWEGVVRVFRGTVSPLDLDRALASPDAVEVPLAVDEGDIGFDLFAFYDGLDVIESGREREEHCDSVANGLPEGPDRRLVEQTCQRIKRQNAVDDPDGADEELLDDSDILTSSLVVSNVDERTIDRQQSVLYRRDGARRRVARGTLVRSLVIGLGVSGAVSGAVAALKWEERAQQEYVLVRAAERVGDDVGRSRHLFYTRGFDRQRNIAIAFGTAAASSAVVAGVFQQLERRRLQRARASLEGGSDEP